MARFQGEGMEKLASMAKKVSARIPQGAKTSVKNHPYLYGIGGMAAAGGIASGRRRSGLDKPQGRPTGIYGRPM